jgi:hypothetical protein
MVQTGRSPPRTSARRGEAWLKHATEEMGNLPNFLPALYEREAGKSPRGSPAVTA